MTIAKKLEESCLRNNLERTCIIPETFTVIAIFFKTFSISMSLSVVNLYT